MSRKYVDVLRFYQHIVFGGAVFGGFGEVGWSLLAETIFFDLRNAIQLYLTKFKIRSVTRGERDARFRAP